MNVCCGRAGREGGYCLLAFDPSTQCYYAACILNFKFR
jgi:hypothetical protein